MRRLLRIGISCYPTYGGSGVIATEIGMAMARLGHKVHFLAYDVPRRLDRFLANIFFHEVVVQDYPLFVYPPYALSLASKMVEVATYEKLDLIHVHYAVPHATSAYLARQVLGDRAPKVITTLHGTDITLVGNDRSYLPITRFSIIQSDGITVPSHFLRHATFDKLNVPTDVPIEVIPNFVDSERFRPRGEAEERGPSIATIGGSDMVLSHVSNFRPVKRIQDVVRVFEIVQRSVPSHLVLVGDGPERSRIEALVRELNLEQKVCFLGKQEDFVPVLQRSDLFLLPSESESFGLAALEALSCGVPVVGAKGHGLQEVVKHGETGFLADVGDVDAMAAFALRVLTDRELRERQSAAARRLVLEKFDQNVMTNAYQDYYYRILGEPAS